MGGNPTNLGNALWRLGEREKGTARLEEAVAVFRGALEELTRERVPLEWAKTQAGLGNVFRRLGEGKRHYTVGRGCRRLARALAVFEATPASFHVSETRKDLAVAERLLADRRYAKAHTLAHYHRDATGEVIGNVMSEGILMLDPPGLSFDVGQVFEGLRD